MSRRDGESCETTALRVEDGVIRLHQQAAAAAAPVPLLRRPATYQRTSHTNKDTDSNFFLKMQINI